MEKTNKNSGEDILKMLGSFDFNAPPKVDVIFEDSDDESAPLDSQQNLTDLLTKKILKDNTNEKTNKETDLIVQSIKKEPEIMTNEQNRLNNENIKKNEKIKEKTNNETCTIEKSSVYKGLETKVVTENNYINNRTNNVMDKINTEKGLKRKHQEDNVLNNKINKTNNSMDNLEMTKKQNENNLVMQNQNTNQIYTQKQQNDEFTLNSAPHMVAYVSNLLKAVSKHMFLIINAYAQYSATKRQTDPAKLQRAWDYFLRVKQHLFNLSYCTFADIILPEIKNKSFINKLLNDTLLLAKEKNVSIGLQTHVEPLFNELVSWTMKTKSAIDKRNTASKTSCQQPNNQQLQLPSDNLHHTTKIASNSVKSPTKKPEEDTNTIVPKPPPLQHPYLMQQLRAPPKIPNSNKLTSVVEKKKEFKIPNLSVPEIDRHYNLHNANTKTNQQPTLRPKNNQFLPENRNIYVDANINMNQNTSSSLNNSAAPKTAHGNHSNAVLFSSGPPGRQLSITVEPSLLSTGNMNYTMNSAQVENPMTKKYITQQQRIHHNQQKTICQTFSWPNQNQRQVYASSESLERQMNINCNQQIPTNYLQQMTNNYNQQMTNNYNQQMRNNYNLQMRNNYNLQMTNNCKQQMTNNYNQHMTNNSYQQMANNCEQVKPAYNCKQQNNPPSYTESIQSFQTEFASFLKPNELQVQIKLSQAPTKPCNPETMQSESSNLEITRSGSTDSGFMSPLNFNTSNESYKDMIEGQNDLVTPIITHITSLNPTVSFIPQGTCKVCGKVTRKMCIGCYGKYYCEPECQRIDWPYHINECKQKPAS